MKGIQMFNNLHLTQKGTRALFKRVVRKITAMSPEQRLETLVRAGIYTEEGQLAEKYGGPKLPQNRKNFEGFIAQIRAKFPTAKIKTDWPEKPTGNCWLDVKFGRKRVTVEWSPKRGFGFFAKDAGYGEGPKDIDKSKEFAFARICSLLK